jgi:hypothetical protein
MDANRRRWGVILAAASYLIFLGSTVGGVLAVRSNTDAHHGLHGAGELMTPWALTLTFTVSVTGVLVVLGPMRHGARLGNIAAAMPWVIMSSVRLANDPRCTANILHEHGCHTLLLASALCITGCLLARNT